jgi:hypothetical protein
MGSITTKENTGNSEHPEVVNGTLLIASSDALEALQLVQAILSNLVCRSRIC